MPAPSLTVSIEKPVVSFSGASRRNSTTRWDRAPQFTETAISDVVQFVFSDAVADFGTSGTGCAPPHLGQLKPPSKTLAGALPVGFAYHGRRQKAAFDEFRALGQGADVRLRAQVQRVLAQLLDVVPVIATMKLPRAIADEGGFTLEWSLPDRRFGLVFERDLDRSGWYFASRGVDGGDMASGSLAEGDLGQVVRWALRLG